MLSRIVQDNMNKICETLRLGRATFAVLTDKIERCEERNIRDFYDEQVWTFLLASSYAMAGSSGATQLASLLTENPQSGPVDQLWFEVLPIPPRHQEGNTHLDLAFGAIAKRGTMESGIEFAPELGDFVGFCEFKWYSDMSIDVSYDRHRNQLARVIENALCFQRNSDLVGNLEGRFPKSVHVTLVTPAIFQERKIRSRLYQYKWPEYAASHHELIDELRACPLKPRTEPGFQYPDLEQRAACLRLHWVSFQSLCKAVPDSPLKAPFQDFVCRFDGTDGHAPECGGAPRP